MARAGGALAHLLTNTHAHWAVSRWKRYPAGSCAVSCWHAAAVKRCTCLKLMPVLPSPPAGPLQLQDNALLYPASANAPDLTVLGARPAS